MKKNIKIIVPTVLLIIAIIIGILFITRQSKPDTKFYLNEEYYNSSEIEEIDIQALDKLAEDATSFCVFVYQPMCMTSSDFESILKNFQEDKKIKFYKIQYSSLSETKYGEKIKYYPSFMIFKKGKLVDFLEANKNEDIKFYRTKKDFEEWLTRYIKL